MAVRAIAGGDRDDRNLVRLAHAPQPTQNQQSIPPNTAAVRDVGRKIEIEEDQIGLQLPNRADRAGAIHSGEHIITSGSEFERYGFEEDDIVIDYQYSFCG